MISIIIPALNEAKVLRATLEGILEQTGRYEVIVADGGSSDGTPELAAAIPSVRVVHAPKGRARQMNAGAHVAQGDLLLFLHADTRLPAAVLPELDSLHAAGAWQAGAFRHRFVEPDWQLRLVSFGNNLRCRLSRIYFGDQAIFVSRSLFERLGGFPDLPVLEDVVFCERLRTVTRAVLLGQYVETDARRFRHHGVWRTTLRGVLILVRHRLGRDSSGHGYVDEVR